MSSSLSKLKVRLLHKNARLPSRGSKRAAGYDLYTVSDVVIAANSVRSVDTGISIALPDNVYGRIAPRSGLALHHFISVGGGVIDQDYRGEIKVILFNHASEPFSVKCGDRIAQLICECIEHPILCQVNELDATERQGSGFGSTGQ